MADPVSSPHPLTYPTHRPAPPPTKPSSATPTPEPPSHDPQQQPPPAAQQQQQQQQQQQDARPPAGRQPAADATAAAELARLQMSLQAHVRQYPDFPAPGILFEDVFPLFRDPQCHADLIRALELFVGPPGGGPGAPDVVVGLDARGFLFGPSLALRLGAGFAPVRKPGKLPGATERVSYVKEYGADHFEIQRDAVRPGQTVLVVDDLMATGECFGPISSFAWFPCVVGGASIPASDRAVLLVTSLGPCWRCREDPWLGTLSLRLLFVAFGSDCEWTFWAFDRVS